MTRRHRTIPSLALAALLLSACGGEPAPVGAGTDAEIAFDVGVTREPCPGGGHPDRGCITLGTILDHSGPFAVAGTLFLDAIRAYWNDVNASGGIAGEFDVVVPDRYAEDNQYLPATHTAAYTRIADHVLALAGSLGTPTTIDALPRMAEDRTLAVPVTFWSGWAFPEIDHGLTLEFLSSYCFEGMNGVDWAVERAADSGEPLRTVGIVFFPSDFGRDYASGVETAVAAHGLEIAWEQPIVPIAAGGDPAQVEAVNRIVTAGSDGRPADLVFMVTGPSELASIVGGAVQRGYEGLFVTGNPGWDAGLMETAAAPAISSGRVFGTGSFGPWGTDTPGHARAQAVLEAAGVEPHDYALSGWISQFRLRAILEAAARRGDLTREGLFRASEELEPVDYEGMLPPGDWSSPETMPRHAIIGRFDRAAPTGALLEHEAFVGPTAEGYAYERPCTATE